MLSHRIFGGVAIALAALVIVVGLALSTTGTASAQPPQGNVGHCLGLKRALFANHEVIDNLVDEVLEGLGNGESLADMVDTRQELAEALQTDAEIREELREECAWLTFVKQGKSRTAGAQLIEAARKLVVKPPR